MVRAAAKNFRDVLVVVDPADYGRLLSELDATPSLAAELPHEARSALEEGRLGAVMFFSPKTARLFLTLAEGLPIAGLTAFCISPATAGALASGIFAQVRIADRPNQAAMLALVNRA